MTKSDLLSVIILTKDEEANLPFALESLRPLNAEMFVIDSGSADATVEIARAAGCNIYRHPFETQARQLNWALDNLPIKTQWVMRLDADERLTPELALEIAQKLPIAPPDLSAFQIKLRIHFWGKWLKHGGLYPLVLLRLWRNGTAKCEERWMDEHMIVASGRIARFDHDLIDENRKGLSFFTDKHNRYSSREVKDLFAIGEGSRSVRPAGQAGRKRYVKENIYSKAPLFWRAFLYWFYRYFLRLGFLDGQPGFVFHFLQAWWYRTLVDAKLREWELKEGSQSANPPSATGTACNDRATN